MTRATEIDGQTTDGMGRVWSDRLGHYIDPAHKDEQEALRDDLADDEPAPEEATDMTTPRTQDLPTSVAIEGEFRTKLFEDLIRSVRTRHRRDLAALRFVVSPATEKKYRDALHARGIPDDVELTDLRYGPTSVEVDETLGDDVILLERKAGVEPQVRRIRASEVRVEAKPVRIPPRATTNEVKGMAEHSKVQNAARGLINFDAGRNIMARQTEVLLDGARVGTVTGFATTLDLSPTARKTRPGVGGTLTVPGQGCMSMDKVNSAWALWIAEGGTLSNLTLRVTISDPGMPNPETTEYRGVRIVSFQEGSATLDDLVSQAIDFTFLDSEVIQPIVEPENDKMYELWEYRHATGRALDKPASLIPA